MHVTFSFAFSSRYAKNRTSNFRKLVRQHTEGMVESIIGILLEIYLSFQQWKNFENLLRIDKVIAIRVWCTTFLGHSVSLCYVEMFCVLIQCYDNIRNDKALADDAVFKILLSRTSTSMFATAATRVWNSLPPDMRKLELSYGQFRRSLNTFLFGQWDHGALWTA